MAAKPYLASRFKPALVGWWYLRSQFPFQQGADMPNPSYLSITGAEQEAIALQTLLETSTIHLYKDTLANPDPLTPLTDFTSNEADFTGYTPGGETVTAFLDPILSGSPQGYQVTSPITQFVVGTPVVTGNVVAGWYLVLATGELYAFGRYDAPQAMQVTGR